MSQANRVERLKQQVWMAEWVIRIIFKGRAEKPITEITSVELQNTPIEKELLKFIGEKFKEVNSMGIDIDDVNELVVAPKRKTPLWIELFGADFGLQKDPDDAMAAVAININAEGYAVSVETEIV